MIILNRVFCLVTIFISSLSFAIAADIDKPLAAASPGDIFYVTGGIGEESRIELEAVKSDYNLLITNAYSSGSYIGEADIAIFNESGENIVNTKAGPLFYVNLPKGKYIIEVVLENDTKKINVIIANVQKNIRFIW